MVSSSFTQLPSNFYGQLVTSTSITWTSKFTLDSCISSKILTTDDRVHTLFVVLYHPMYFHHLHQFITRTVIWLSTVSTFVFIWSDVWPLDPYQLQQNKVVWPAALKKSPRLFARACFTHDRFSTFQKMLGSVSVETKTWSLGASDEGNYQPKPKRGGDWRFWLARAQIPGRKSRPNPAVRPVALPFGSSGLMLAQIGITAGLTSRVAREQNMWLISLMP